MIKLDQKQIEKTKGFSEEFRQKYLDTDRGKEHIHRYLSEIDEVNEIYKKIVDGRDKLSQLWSFKSEPLWVWRCWEKDL